MHESSSTLFLSIIVLLVIAFFTSYYAIQKGRNPYVWFVIALLIGVFAPLILFFLSDLEGEEDDMPSMTISSPDIAQSSDHELRAVPRGRPNCVGQLRRMAAIRCHP